MGNLRIGITIGLKDVNESVWTNGMKLNILYLARLLKNSKNNYEVSILNTTDIDVNAGSKTFEEFNLLYIYILKLVTLEKLRKLYLNYKKI